MEPVVATSAAQWRAWLARNHDSAREAWLVLFHQDSGLSSLRYHEAVEQALCYGWIDGLHRRRDARSTVLRFTPRTDRSTWSPLNRRRAARMVELGQMTPYGQAAIDAAQARGTWDLASDSLTVPSDLRCLLDANEAAAQHFAAFPPSSKRLILWWIVSAKRRETRQRRIVRTVELAEQNIRANHPPGRASGVRSAAEQV